MKKKATWCLGKCNLQKGKLNVLPLKKEGNCDINQKKKSK